MAEPAADVIRRAQAGDTAALLELVEGQQTYVYSIALSIMRNPADAADMTQEAFIKLLRGLPTYRSETKFTTWLYRLATNVCLDGLRRRGRPVESLNLVEGGALEDDGRTAAERLADEDRWTQPEPAQALGESAAEVRAALDRLPTAQRLALTLHYFEDMRYEEVAEVMALPLNTVKSHIRRGKERLATLLQPTLEATERGGKEAQPCGAGT